MVDRVELSRHDARLVLRDRVLIATSSNLPPGFGELIEEHSATSGVVAIGPAAAGEWLKRRGRGFTGVLALDPAAYSTRQATAIHPLLLDEQDLFGSCSIQGYIESRSEDLDAVFSPTGMIAKGDVGALEAVVAACNRADHPKLVTTLPVENDWLSEDRRGTLVQAIKASTHPVAVLVVGQFDPLEFRQFGEGLTWVLQQSRVILHRADMTAFQAIPRGAAAASIGLTASLRHTVPVGRFPRRRRKGTEPGVSVFVPGINEFRDVTTLEEWWGDDAPRCELDGCCGSPLTAFTVDDRHALALHNGRHCLSIADDMLSCPVDRRRDWLRLRRDETRMSFEELRVRTGRRDIRPYGSANYWLSFKD
jgi:hypothetical protein